MSKVLLDNLDLWTSSVRHKSTAGRGSNSKIELAGIKKLRELILELAVRGKLVPQDPNDEPASELLKRIEAEKTELIKAGKLKKQKPLPEISDDEKPFELPKGWEWVRLGEIGSWAIGNGFPEEIQGETSGSILLCKVSDMNLPENSKFIETTNNKIDTFKALDKKLNIHPEGTVIFPKIGGAIATNKRRIIKFPTAIDNNCLGISPFKSMTTDFLFTYLTSLDLTKYQAGTSVPALSQGSLALITLALPPLNEQQRIVAKVDELMTLCDQLEQQSEQQLNAHQQLVETLLATLTNAENADELNQQWQRLAQHFDLLFSGPMGAWAIDRLKETILQLAVMGKLVPQDPTDEPASELLKRIEAEKETLFLNKNKGNNHLNFHGLDEIKTVIPSSWEWVRLSDIANIVRGGSPRPAGDSRFYGGSIPFLKVADITNNKGMYIEGYTTTITKDGLNKTRYIDTRTVLLSNSGATLGIPAICTFPTTFNDGIAAFIDMSSLVNDEYLYWYLKKLTKWFLNVASQGQGQPNLNTDIIKSVWFSIPPYNEQKRIVGKIDQLFSLCDQLKEKLNLASQTQLQLVDAVVDQALN